MPLIDKIDRTTDVVILAFYYAQEIEGVTKVQKILYLIEKETDFWEKYKDKISEDLDFKAYDMGPFSEDVYDELELLLNIDVIEKEDMNIGASDMYERKQYVPEEGSKGLSNKVFKLTAKGEKIGQALEELLDEKHAEELESKIREYNRMSLNTLLEYVYTNYPAATENSKIKDEVLGG